MNYSRRAMSFFVATLCCSLPVLADNDEQQCVLKHYYSDANNTVTLKALRELCQRESEILLDVVALSGVVEKNRTLTNGNIAERIRLERITEFNPYVITPHKINYMLPAMSSNAINRKAYSSQNGFEKNLSDVEAKFQISLKVPLNNDSLFIENDGLYVGFTMRAWWQIYSSNISKPFRETNYQPELFYFAPMQWKPFDGHTALIVGIEHQSNGRSQILSRSWNRVYTQFIFEKDDFALSFKPWVRLSEKAKKDPLDPKGDDNPDIADYMGHFELGMVYKLDDLQFSAQGRQNFSTHKGSAEFGLTFPLYGKLRGYATVFSGYGESLIDYNYNQTRFGLGIALNNVL